MVNTIHGLIKINQHGLTVDFLDDQVYQMKYDWNSRALHCTTMLEAS